MSLQFSADQSKIGVDFDDLPALLDPYEDELALARDLLGHEVVENKSSDSRRSSARTSVDPNNPITYYRFYSATSPENRPSLYIGQSARVVSRIQAHDITDSSPSTLATPSRFDFLTSRMGGFYVRRHYFVLFLLFWAVGLGYRAYG